MTAIEKARTFGRLRKYGVDKANAEHFARPAVPVTCEFGRLAEADTLTVGDIWELADEIDRLRADGATLRERLAECYRLTGADPDGNEDWRLAEDAVHEVREMRADMDVLADDLMTAQQEASAAEEAVGKLTLERDSARAQFDRHVAWASDVIHGLEVDIVGLKAERDELSRFIASAPKEPTP